MVNSCSFKGCVNSTQGKCTVRTANVQFHRFPKDQNEILEWKRICGLRENDVVTWRRICSEHFHHTNYDNDGKLVEGSRPNVNLVTEKIPRSNKENTRLLEKYKLLQKKYRTLKEQNKSVQTKMKIMKASHSRQIHSLTASKNFWRSSYKLQLQRKLNTERKLKNTIKETKAECQLMIDRTLGTILTKTQTRVLQTGRKWAKWSDEDISRAIALRAKSNAAYIFIRSVFHFPLPSVCTLKRWMRRIEFDPGVLSAVLRLVAAEFSGLSEFHRQAVVSFDEMSTDSSISYDPVGDQIVGPHSNMLVAVIRGMFVNWKQPVYYGFDTKFDRENFLQMIHDCENAGVIIRGISNDLGTKNQGLWNELGISSGEDLGKKREMNTWFESPVNKNKIFAFADPPHLLKLIRNNLLKNVFHLKNENGPYDLSVEDLKQIVINDKSELKIHHKLTMNHLELRSFELQNVRQAAETLSHSTAAALRLVSPHKNQQADFIELVNQWFDLMNSRSPRADSVYKSSYGKHLGEQNRILDKMVEVMKNLRVGSAKNALLPFQKGIIITTISIQELYKDLKHSPMNIEYINTHVINTDVSENTFSMIRSIGHYNDHPNSYDAKNRLKQLMLSWSFKHVESSSYLDSEPDGEFSFITSRMLKPLMQSSLEDEDSAEEAEEIDPSEMLQRQFESEFKEYTKYLENETSSEQEIQNTNDQICNEMCTDKFYGMNSENWNNYTEILTAAEKCELGGKEYVCGFIASKFKSKYPELVLKPEILKYVRESWCKQKSNGGLTIPADGWFSVFLELNEKFELHHDVDSFYKIRGGKNVMKTLTTSLSAEYPDIPREVVKFFVKVRTFIRIKHVNSQIQAKKKSKRERRKKTQFAHSSILYNNDVNMELEI